MENINAQDLLARLQSEFKYPPKGAQLIADKITASQPKVQAAFVHWWTTGNYTPIEAAGYSWQDLMQNHGMNPIAALLTLDWLIREPEKAKQSLRKGHDRLDFNKKK